MKGEGNSPGTVAHSPSGGPQGLQAAEQPGLTLTADSPNPNHRLPHLLGHHASWGSWPLLWGLIVVRVIWGEKCGVGSGGRLRSKEPGLPSWAPGPGFTKAILSRRPPLPTWPGFQKKAQETGSAIYTLGASEDVTRGCLATTGRSEEVASLGIRVGTIHKSNMN